MYEGRGAGEGPTSSAVVADIADIASGRNTRTFGIPAVKLSKLQTVAMSERVGSYYARFTVIDKPGVFAEIAAALRDHDVSMEAVLQRGRAPGEPVSVVLTTHETREANMMATINTIDETEGSGGAHHDDQNRTVLRLRKYEQGASKMNEQMTKMDRNLALETVRVTEAAALAASRWMGRGDEKAADQAAVDAMRTALNSLGIKGTVRIGEGERDEAPMLFIGEEVGLGDGPEIDIALDPLEGTTITAKGGTNALAVIAMAEAGGFLHAPDTYMEKIAVGNGLPEGVVDLDEKVEVNLRELAKAKGVEISDLVGLRARSAPA